MHVEKQVFVGSKEANREVNKIVVSEYEAKVLNCLDETIMDVAEKVKKEEIVTDGYADAVKALATLVEARAKLV